MKTALLAAVTVCVATPVAAEPVQLAELSFERGSASVSRDDARWDRILAWADDHPDAVIVVGGHAHREGSARDAARLSFRRAQAVRDVLVAFGVNPDQIVIATYGEGGTRRSVVIWGSDSR